jgi:uncharacterized membrane protein
MNGALLVTTLVAAVGSGLVAGVFFTFSTFVMAALRRLPPAQGVTAMQSINVLAVTPGFMTLLFGTAIASLVLIVWLVAFARIEHEWLIVGGGIVYLLGSIGVTIACNVPLNDRLAAMKPEEANSREFWQFYARRWTLWNHVRTLSSAVAALMFTIALHVQ